VEVGFEAPVAWWSGASEGGRWWGEGRGRGEAREREREREREGRERQHMQGHWSLAVILGLWTSAPPLVAVSCCHASPLPFQRKGNENFLFK
jgi:hypothetical protein